MSTRTKQVGRPKIEAEPVIVDVHGKVIGDAALWDDMLSDISWEDEREERMLTAIDVCNEDGISPEDASEMYGVYYGDLIERLKK